MRWLQKCRQPHSDQRFNLGPNPRIAFDGGVSLKEEAVVPRISPTLGRLLFVCEAEIAKDPGARWIRCGDLGTPVQNTARLIEVNGFSNVSRSQNRPLHFS